MGFGRQFKDLPIPESIVFRVKIFTRIAGALVVMIQGWDFIPAFWTKIITGVLVAAMTISRDIEGMFGVSVPGAFVKTKDVEVIKDEAVKVIIFIILSAAFIYSL